MSRKYILIAAIFCFLSITPFVTFASTPRITIANGLKNGGSSGLAVNTVWTTINGKTWTKTNSNVPWGFRNSPTLVYFKDKLWRLGGGDPYSTTGYASNDVWSSKNNGQTWTKVTTHAPWAPRANHTNLVFDNKIWILGGSDAGFYNDVWNSTDGINWTQVIAQAPWSARSEHTSVVFDGKIWVIGGADCCSTNGSVNDVWSSLDGVTWTQVAANASWSKRHGHSSVVFGNKIWVLGGNEGNNYGPYLNDVWSSLDGATWTQETPAASWSKRSSFGAAVLNGKMWIYGGLRYVNNFTYLTDGWNSTDGVTWSKVVPTSSTTWPFSQGRSNFGIAQTQ